MVALDQAFAIADGTLPHQRRSVIEQHNIHLVGAQDTTGIAGETQLKVEAVARVEARVMPDRDIDIR